MGTRMGVPNAGVFGARLARLLGEDSLNDAICTRPCMHVAMAGQGWGGGAQNETHGWAHGPCKDSPGTPRTRWYRAPQDCRGHWQLSHRPQLPGIATKARWRAGGVDRMDPGARRSRRSLQCGSGRFNPCSPLLRINPREPGTHTCRAPTLSITQENPQHQIVQNIWAPSNARSGCSRAWNRECMGTPSTCGDRPFNTPIRSSYRASPGPSHPSLPLVSQTQGNI